MRADVSRELIARTERDEAAYAFATISRPMSVTSGQMRWQGAPVVEIGRIEIRERHETLPILDFHSAPIDPYQSGIVQFSQHPADVYRR